MIVDVDQGNAKRKSVRSPIDPAAIAAACLLQLYCVLFAWRPIVNYSDFWNHAAIGRWICTHGQVPTHCLFLWTSNAPYVAHSWLSEYLIYQLVRAAGEKTGAFIAIVAVALVSFASCFLLWQLCRVTRKTVSLAFLLFIMAIYCAGERFEARPEIFSFFLFALLLRLLAVRGFATDPSERRSDVKFAAVLISLFILWTNLHGAVLTGIMALWTIAGVALIEDRGSRQSRVLLCLAAACTAATVVNPYGYHYYAIYRMPSKIVFDNIAEWKSLFAAPAVPTVRIVMRFILAAAAFICWLRTPGRRWSNLALLIVFTIMAVSVRRNVVYFALVCLAVAVPYFRAEFARLTDAETGSTGTRRSQSRGRTQSKAATAPRPYALPRMWAVAAAIFFVWSGWSVLPMLQYGPTAGLATSQTEIIKKLGIDGRVFNYYDCASYLEWRFGGDPDLYIDSVNAYPDSVFDDYWDIRDANAHGLQLLDSQQIDCVIGEGFDSAHPTLTQDDEIYVRVAQSPAWALLYYGPDGPIWIRRLPQYEQQWEGVPVFNGRSMDEFLRYLSTCSRYYYGN